jgi:hypothetical protein
MAPPAAVPAQPVEAAAAAPARHRRRLAAPVRVRTAHAEAPIELASAEVPKLDLPPFGTPSAAPQLAEEGDGPTLAADFARDSAVAPPAPVHAVFLRRADGQTSVAIRASVTQYRMIYHLVDAAQRKAIERAIRSAMAQSRQAQEHARAVARLAQTAEAESGGAWSGLQFQLVGEPD